MILVKNKNECCGCEACAQKCPKSAIKLITDSEGFWYPQVEKDKCISCGLCDKVCPESNITPRKNIRNAYAMQSNNISVRMKSTAGGAFYTLTKPIIDNGGIVFGATYSNGFEVIHCKAETEEELLELCMSKYVQSKLGDTFQQVEKLLKNKRQVCFVGTPCQVEGLVRFLGKEYDNLLLIDLVCHGVPSPKVWKKYTLAMSKEFDATRFEFRNKDLGYSKSGMAFVDEKCKMHYANQTDNLEIKFMSKAFFAEICSRPSCHTCKFKTRERVSDLTLGDLWNIKKYDVSYDDDLGTTFVAVHSEKGVQALQKSTDCRFIAVELEKYLKDDGVNIICSMSANGKRTEFFENLDDKSLNELIESYLQQTYNPIKETVKIILKKIGILYIFQRLNYKRKKYNYERKGDYRR